MDEPPDITKVAINEYLAAHARSNGGWRDFFHSNLFAALVVFTLTQAVLIAGMLVAVYWKVNSVSEWRAQTDAVIKQHQEIANAYRTDSVVIHSDIAALKDRTNRIENQTEHLDVLESEHRRLTQDVEKIKGEKK